MFQQLEGTRNKLSFLLVRNVHNTGEVVLIPVGWCESMGARKTRATILGGENFKPAPALEIGKESDRAGVWLKGERSLESNSYAVASGSL